MSENLWVDKYRPSDLKGVIGNIDNIQWMINVSDGKEELPHLIISGPNGVGKTVSARCLAREILKNDYKNSCFEVYSYDKKGVDLFRKRIPTFATKKVSSPFKIILIDDADNLGLKTQQSLSGLLEKHNRSIRFIFICRNKNSIIEQIHSHSTILRLVKLKNAEIKEHLREIARKEGVKYSDDGLGAVAFISGGDMRSAINLLQLSAMASDFIDKEAVYQVSDKPASSRVKKILKYAEEYNMDKLVATLDGLVEMGYSNVDILDTLFKVAVDASMDEELRMLVLMEIGNAHQIALDKDNSHIQLLSLISKIADLYKLINKIAV